MSITNAANAATKYQSINVDASEVASPEQPRRCNKRRCSIITAIATAIILIGGGIAAIATVDRCKTIQCAPQPNGADCECISQTQYAAYQAGNYTCNPCRNTDIPRPGR